jgi:hypothetical protein
LSANAGAKVGIIFDIAKCFRDFFASYCNFSLMHTLYMLLIHPSRRDKHANRHSPPQLIRRVLQPTSATCLILSIEEVLDFIDLFVVKPL